MTADAGLLIMCATAFSAVFVLLVFLAACIRVLTLAFPERELVRDAELAAAIVTVVAAAYPGMRVTRIEEES